MVGNCSSFCSHPERCQHSSQLRYSGLCLWVALNHLGHPVKAVDHRRVVTATECCSDLDKLHPEQVSRQVHCDLSWDSQGFGSCLRAQAVDCSAPFLGHSCLDDTDVQPKRCRVSLTVFQCLQLVPEGLTGHLNGHRLVAK